MVKLKSVKMVFLPILPGKKNIGKNIKELSNEWKGDKKIGNVKLKSKKQAVKVATAIALQKAYGKKKK